MTEDRKPPSRPVARPAPDASLTTEVQAAAEILRQKNPYLKLAWKSPYNLALFLGALGASALTLNPVLALAAVGLEAIWLLNGPESGFLRRLLWDPKLSRFRTAMEAAERERLLQGVGKQERERVLRLVAHQQEIRRLAAQNPSFAGDLLRDELIKTDRLVQAFIEMAVTCARYEQYLASVNADALEKDRRRYEATTKSGSAEAPQTEIARKNLAIVWKRLEKLKEIERYLGVAKGQLDLIENSFQLIADQIVTMQSPQQLSGQLDELLDGVEAIRQTARDTEEAVGPVGPSRS